MITNTQIPWSQPDIGEDEFKLVRKVLESSWFSTGPMVKEFENKLANYCGAKHVVMVNNGTSALIATYLAAGIKSGDKVLVPSYTFIATVNALLLLGAKPILLDADPGTLNVTPETIDQALKRDKDVRFAVFVDVAGMPCDIDGITEVCEKHSVSLIEDAAEAIGAEYKGKKIGGIGKHPSVFSFHAAKLLTAIEGGAIATNDSEFAEKIRLIRSHGEDPKRKYVHIMIGLNLRPLELQGAFALAQLPKVDKYIDNRNLIARLYIESLKEKLDEQHIPDYVTRHPYMLYLSLTKDKQSKDKLVNSLTAEGIDYRMPWPPVNMQQIGYDFTNMPCPNAENLFSRAISFPMFNSIKIEQAQRVIEVVKNSHF
ncbi:MAG: DegT/DnrJ/EryC1/StrS family aminotransferase [Nitrososphaerales archaeon]